MKDQPSIYRQKASYTIRVGNPHKKLHTRWRIADYFITYKGITYYIGHVAGLKEYTITIGSTGYKLPLESDEIRKMKPEKVSEYIKKFVDSICEKMGEKPFRVRVLKHTTEGLDLITFLI